jgi:hypothetical protein
MRIHANPWFGGAKCSGWAWTTRASPTQTTPSSSTDPINGVRKLIARTSTQ